MKYDFEIIHVLHEDESEIDSRSNFQASVKIGDLTIQPWFNNGEVEELFICDQDKNESFIDINMYHHFMLSMDNTIVQLDGLVKHMQDNLDVYVKCYKEGNA